MNSKSKFEKPLYIVIQGCETHYNPSVRSNIREIFKNAPPYYAYNRFWIGNNETGITSMKEGLTQLFVQAHALVCVCVCVEIRISCNRS